MISGAGGASQVNSAPFVSIATGRLGSIEPDSAESVYSNVSAVNASYSRPVAFFASAIAPYEMAETRFSKDFYISEMSDVRKNIKGNRRI
jgi:hypothetical protein